MDNQPGLKIKYADRLLIGGRWVEPLGGGRVQIVSPETEQVVASTALASEADMDLAVAGARKAFDEGPWPTLPAAERVAALKRMVEALRRREGELAIAVTLQTGALVPTAGFLTAEGHGHFDRAAELGLTFAFQERVESKTLAAAYVVREPVGVVVAIAPWNSPYMTMAGKVAPALLAGCAVIMKPAPETPLEAYILAECGEEAGLPPGVLTLVPSEREAADHLVRSSGIDKVSFTGSTGAGRRIASVCGERMTRCTTELGGKSAAIVLDDYPIEAAADMMANTITMMSGQICAMLTRVVVSRDRHDALADAIAEKLQQVKVGPPSDAGSQMGPIAHRRQLERIESYIDIGKKEGARLVTGGGRPTHLNEGCYIEPTLFADVRSDMTIAQEEIFGPVLSLIPCDGLDDAVRIANDSIYGLSGSVLTNNVSAAYDVARRVRTGNFAQNGLKGDFALPFGGYKSSGIGREGGAEGLSAYLETKTIMLDEALPQ